MYIKLLITWNISKTRSQNVTYQITMQLTDKKPRIEIVTISYARIYSDDKMWR